MRRATGDADRPCDAWPSGRRHGYLARGPLTLRRPAGRRRRRPAPRARCSCSGCGAARSSTSPASSSPASPRYRAWLVDVIVIVTRLLAVVALVGGLVIAVRSGGWRMVGTAGLGAAIAAVLILLLEGLDPRSGTTAVTVTDSLGPLSATGFPTAVGLGTVTAALDGRRAVAQPPRAPRRLGARHRGLALNHFLVTPASFDTLRAVLCGWLAGAAALVVLGGPSRRPTVATVSAGLARCRRAPRPPGAGQRRRPRVDALLRRHDGRPGALRQGARGRPAQRRPPVPDVPRRRPTPAGRRAAVLVAATHRRARGARGVGRA